MTAAAAAADVVLAWEGSNCHLVSNYHHM